MRFVVFENGGEKCTLREYLSLEMTATESELGCGTICRIDDVDSLYVRTTAQS